MKVLVIGAGKMTEAILMGLVGEVDFAQYYIYSPSGTSAKSLAQDIGANHVQDLIDVQDPSYVWIGCKPQQLKDLSQVIFGRYPKATFVSMLAAVSETQQLKLLGASKLVRIMPNLSVKQKRGVTLISSSSASGELSHLSALFSSLGKSIILNEEELEELTLLTGSGPALFYEFAKNLAGNFTSLTADQREELARMVLQGAGVSVSLNPKSLQAMIDEVTSKGGVTISVLDQWRKDQVEKILGKGIEAGKKRSEEIKQSILQN